MHIRFSALAPRLVFLGVIGALIAGSVEPVSADIPLPIIDIVPISTFSVTENAVDPNNAHPDPTPLNGQIQLDGTFTLPLFVKGLSGAYDRVQQGALDSALAAVPLPGGGTLYPGGSRDLVQTERLDYHTGPINFELGEAYRHRMCCPFNSAEWHKAYLGLSYTSPSLVFLNHGVFVVNISGNDSGHYVHPQPLPGGLNVNKTKILTTNQSITAVIPIDAKSGVRTATTFVWGALDYFENSPFPSYYDIFVFSGTKQVNSMFGVTANLTQVHQRIQGSPFPAPGGVETSALNVFADIHLNFADFLKKPAQTTGPARPIQPGGAGAAGGPAPVNKSQGGTVSPAPGAPEASPGAMMPAASPAPMMPGASPAPEMSASPAPMMSGSPAPSPTP